MPVGHILLYNVPEGGKQLTPAVAASHPTTVSPRMRRMTIRIEKLETLSQGRSWPAMLGLSEVVVV